MRFRPKKARLSLLPLKKRSRSIGNPGVPACQLRWLPLFPTGLPLQHEDIALVIEELECLKQWLSWRVETGLPQAVMLYGIDQLM